MSWIGNRQEDGKTGGIWGFRKKPSRLPAFLFQFLLALTLFSVPAAAQTPPSPSTLPSRQANYAWDKTLLRASFSYRDAIDAAIAPKIDSGLWNDVAMRAYVFKAGDSAPIALAVRTCKVIYDLWQEVYRIKVTELGKQSDTAVLTMDGVRRVCAEARDLAIADRTILQAGAQYFLAVVVEVNPVSPAMLAQMQRWMSRPGGSTALNPGDALFGSFASLFARQIGKSDKTTTFRTQPVVP
jgi:hypothetical protein